MRKREFYRHYLWRFRHTPWWCHSLAGIFQYAATRGLGPAFRHWWQMEINPRHYRLRHRDAAVWIDSLQLRTSGGLSVHLLTGHRDLTMALITLASWVRHYGADCSPNFHDDGSLLPEDLARVRRIFPDARVWLRAESDLRVDAVLQQQPLCRALRRRCVMLLKFFDPLILGTGRHRLLLDTDVLCFAPPVRIRDIVAGGEPGNFFNRDLSSRYCIDPTRAAQLIGVELAESLNAGLSLVQPDSVNWDDAEQWLPACDFVGQAWLVEQTLYALFSSRYGVTYLPSEYVMSSSRHLLPGTVTKHYFGGIRELFYLEGFPRVVRAFEGDSSMEAFWLVSE